MNYSERMEEIDLEIDAMVDTIEDCNRGIDELIAERINIVAYFL